MNNRWMMIRQLDRQLKEWKAISKKYGKPRAGWVKTIRVALNMTVLQLAERLQLSRSRINQLENAEIHEAITLRTLKEVANAMDCEFIYALVPKGNLSLESIIQTRAETLAKESVANVAHSMSLESQAVNHDVLKKQQAELARKLMETLNKKFWFSAKNKNTENQLKKKK